MLRIIQVPGYDSDSLRIALPADYKKDTSSAVQYVGTQGPDATPTNYLGGALIFSRTSVVRRCFVGIRQSFLMASSLGSSEIPWESELTGFL